MVPPPDDPLAQVAPALAALAEADPGREACGLVVATGAGVVEPWPFRNAAADPARSYLLAPAEVLGALRRLDATGGVILAVYHTHLEGGGELSRADLDVALVDGRPLLEGVAQLVVALVRGEAQVVRCHRWDGSRYVSYDLWTRRNGVVAGHPRP